MSLLFSGNYFKNCFMKLTMTQGIFHITTHHGTIHITHTFSRTKTLGGGQGILLNIRNHVYKAKRASQLSKLDQENLQLKIEEWKKLTLQSHFHFCPTSQHYTVTIGHVKGRAAAHWQYCMSTKSYGNKSSWKDMVTPSHIWTLREALFFLALKTNVGYSVVGEFFKNYRLNSGSSI